MIKKYFFLVINYVFVEGLSRIILFFLVPIYVQSLGLEAYGIYTIYSYWLAIFSMLVGCGLTNGVSQYIYDSENTDPSAIIWSPVVQITAVTVFMFIVLSIIETSIIKSDLVANNYILFYPILLISVFITSMNSYLKSCFLYLEKVKYVNISNLIALTISALLSLLLLVKFNLPVLYYAIATTIGMLASLIYLSIMMVRRYKFSYSSQKLKQLNVFSFPLYVSSCVMFLMETMDRYYIQSRMSLENNAIFGISYQFSSMVGLLTSSFLSVWPGMYHRNKTKVNDQVLLSNLSIIYTGASILVLIAITFFSEVMTEILYTENIKIPSVIILFLSAIYLQQGFYTVTIMRNLVEGRGVEKTKMELVFFAASFALLNFTVDTFSIVEVVLMKFLTYVFLILAFVYLNNRRRTFSKTLTKSMLICQCALVCNLGLIWWAL